MSKLTHYIYPLHTAIQNKPVPTATPAKVVITISTVSKASLSIENMNLNKIKNLPTVRYKHPGALFFWY